MQVALDAMGGGRAPGALVAGAAQALAAHPALHVTLVGDQARLTAEKTKGSFPDRIDVFHCTQAIDAAEPAVAALRRKPDSSISRCWQLLAENKVDAVVSAGPPEAVVAAGLRLRRFLAPVHQPGLAAVLPTRRGPCVLIDVGANPQPQPPHLYQYGVMGCLFAEHVLRRPRPVVGLLSSAEAARSAEARFRAGPRAGQFLGRVEARDVLDGACDVTVCDGFSGNLVFQACRGACAFLQEAAARELGEALGRELPPDEPALRALADRCDAGAHGGSLLLGLEGLGILTSEAGDERAVQSALELAVRCAGAGLNEHIVRELESTPAGEDV